MTCVKCKADLPEGAGGQRIEQVRTFMDGIVGDNSR